MLSDRLLLQILKIGAYLAPLTLFVFWQKTVHPFVVPKIIFFEILIEVLLLVWLLLILWYPKYRPKFDMLTIAFFGFIGILLITAMLGVNFDRSFWSVVDRSLGIFALLHFAGFYLILKALAAEINWRRYIYYHVYVSLAVALLALLQKFKPSLFLVTEGSRPGGTLGNPSFLAAYLIFTCFLALWLAYTEGRKRGLLAWQPLALYAVAGFQGVIIFLTNTRGAILGLAAGIGVLLLYLAIKKSKPAIALLAIGAVVLGTFFFTRQAAVWQSIPGFDRLARVSTEDATVRSRLIVWNVALTSFTEKPITGWGFENFRYAFDRHYEPTLFRAGFSEVYWDKPHNVYLEILVTSGLVGALAYLSLIGAMWLYIRRTGADNFRPFGYALLAGYLVQNLVIFDTFGSYLMLAVFLAFLEFHRAAAPAPEPKKSIAVPIYLKYGAGAAALVLAIYVMILNVNVLRANGYQYHGLNFFVNRLPVGALESYKAGLAVSYPYKIEIRQSFLEALKQMVFQVPIPDAKQNIQFALDTFDEVIEADPRNHYWYYTIADARNAFFYTDSAFLEGGEEELEIADQLSPRRQQILFVSSKRKYLLKDYTGAIADMKAAVELDPKSPDPRFLYALLLIDDAQDELGFTELFRALELGRVPKNNQEVAIVYKNFVITNQIQEGAKYFEIASQMQPNNIDFLLNAGLLNYQAGNPQTAKQYFERVLEIVPELTMTDRFIQELKPIFEEVGVRFN